MLWVPIAFEICISFKKTEADFKWFFYNIKIWNSKFVGSIGFNNLYLINLLQIKNSFFIDFCQYLIFLFKIHFK